MNRNAHESEVGEQLAMFEAETLWQCQQAEELMLKVQWGRQFGMRHLRAERQLREISNRAWQTAGNTSAGWNGKGLPVR